MENINNVIYETRKIYGKLADDTSKIIYVNRMLYNLTSDEKYLREIIKEYAPVKALNIWLSLHNKKKKVIFGAGKNGKKIKKLFPNEDWICFIDNNVKVPYIDGLEVISLEKLMKCKEEFVVIISPVKGYEEIEHQLYDCGIDNNDIFVFGEKVLKQKEYFEDFIPHSEQEVFVDAGVYDGQTTIEFTAWSQNKYEQIYMFEPSTDYYKRFYKNVEQLERCNWIKKGLWKAEGNLKVFERPDHDIATMENLDGVRTEAIYEEGNWIEIPVTSLDESLKDKRITLIKMDIEGSEYDALLGCKNIISTQNPKLIICLYHKLEDVWTIPELILNINPNYKLYVRHYSMGALDTVIYAI